MKEARNPHPGALPNYQNAVIRQQKLARYLLNPLHPVGRHKARVFKSALGYDQSRWSELAQVILTEIGYFPVNKTESSEWGEKYQVIISILGVDRKVDLLTVWIVRPGTDFPSLVTAYVMEEVGAE